MHYQVVVKVVQSINVLRSLPALNSGLGSYRDYIKDNLNHRLLVVSNDITKQLSRRPSCIIRCAI